MKRGHPMKKFKVEKYKNNIYFRVIYRFEE